MSVLDCYVESVGAGTLSEKHILKKLDLLGNPFTVFNVGDSLTVSKGATSALMYVIADSVSLGGDVYAIALGSVPRAGKQTSIVGATFTEIPANCSESIATHSASFESWNNQQGWADMGSVFAGSGPGGLCPVGGGSWYYDFYFLASFSGLYLFGDTAVTRKGGVDEFGASADPVGGMEVQATEGASGGFSGAVGSAPWNDDTGFYGIGNDLWDVFRADTEGAENTVDTREIKVALIGDYRNKGYIGELQSLKESQDSCFLERAKERRQKEEEDKKEKDDEKKVKQNWLDHIFKLAVFVAGSWIIWKLTGK